MQLELSYLWCGEMGDNIIPTVPQRSQTGSYDQ